MKRVATPPPHPLTLTAYPTPSKKVPPFFFIKMTAKDVNKITYYALDHFLKRFWSDREKP